MKFFAHLRTPPRVASGESGSIVDPGDRRSEQPPSRGAALMVVAAIASLILYAAVTGLGDLQAEIPLFLSLYALLFLGFVASMTWWWRARGFRPFLWGLVAALAFRAVLVPALPSLSDDVHRYLWDGRVVASGVNPYLHAPDDPALVSLRDANWEQVGHRDIPGVYPPVSQAAFGLLGGSLGLGPIGWKAALLLPELGVLLLLAVLLRRHGLPEGRAMVYGWCPLVVIEVAGSGHLEPLAVLPALAALLLLSGGRIPLGGVWLALATGVRLVHAGLAPVWWRRLGFAGLAAFVLVTILLWAPFLGGGTTDGLGEYGRRWEYNSVVYPGVESVLTAIGPTEPLKAGITLLREKVGDVPGLHALYYYTDVPFLSRAVIVATFGIWSLAVGWRTLPVERAAYLALAAFLILSPTLHPWYVVQIVPFLAFCRSLAWLTFTGTVTLSYVSVLSTPAWEVPGWALACEFVPLGALMLGAYWLPGRPA